MADPPGSKFAMLQELHKRQQAILGGLQGQAMYPDVGGGTVGDFGDAMTPAEQQEQRDLSDDTNGEMSIAELAAERRAGGRGQGAAPRDHDGIAEMSDAKPDAQESWSPEKRKMAGDLDAIGKPDFSQATTNRYEYKPEFKGAQGAGHGTYEGPMSEDLKGIPGVVEPGPDGMDRVNHGRLSMANASATGENVREIDQLRKRLAALEGGLGGSAEDTLKNAQSGR